MDFHGGITARLLGASELVDLVAARVYWLTRPENSPLPAITLQVPSDPRAYNLDGDDGVRTTRLQVDCWAETMAQALAIASAVRNVLTEPEWVDNKQFAPGLVESQRDLGEEISSGIGAGSGRSFLHRQSIDFLIRHVGD